MLGTAGHVDHGKTALVKLLTGCNTDTLAEEQQRGLTIDLGFAPCRMADQRVVGVVDVPGHVDFIRNMVAGAHGIDVVILVVAADDGVMPQTREHLAILRLMGRRHGLVALTKVDLVEPARREAVLADVRGLLAGTFLEAAPICPLSTVTGEGFEAFFEALNQAVGACEDRPCGGLFRSWVADVFTIRGFGTVVTGIPSSGAVEVGDPLRLVPTSESARVRRLEVYGEDAAVGRAGECVALNLPELDHASVRRGMVLYEPEGVAPVSMVEGELELLDSVEGTLKDYVEVHVHLGTASGLARVAMLEHASMAAGQRQMIQLRLAEPLGIVPGDRFVIRSSLAGAGQGGLATIGGGRVLGASNARLRRQRPWTLAALAARRTALDDPLAWCETMLRESHGPVGVRALARSCFVHEPELAPVLAKLRDQGRLVETSDHRWLHRDSVERMAARAIEALRAFHAAQPGRLGVEREELRSSLAADAELFEWAVSVLIETGRVETQGTVLCASGWRPRVSGAVDRLAEQVEATLQQAGWAPPTLDELALALREPVARIEGVVGLLGERGVLVRLDARLVMHRDAIEAARQVALRLFGRARSFTTMAFRDALGVSRKYAVPVLDYFDRTRFTVRAGHDRTPGVEARSRLGGNHLAGGGAP